MAIVKHPGTLETDIDHDLRTSCFFKYRRPAMGRSVGWWNFKREEYNATKGGSMFAIRSEMMDHED